MALAIAAVDSPRFGRRRSSVLLFAGAASAFLASTTLQQDSNLLLPVVMAGKFCITGAFNIAYTFVAELFHTPIRSTALGYVTIWARLGGIFAPVVPQVAVLSPALPMLVFGLLCAGASVAIALLPETL